MEIQINSLWHNPVGSQQEFDMPSADIEIFEGTSAHFSGKATITRLEDSLFVKITGTAKVNLSCHKCLKTFPQNIEFKSQIEFTRNADFDDASKFPIGKHQLINLEEPIRQEILATLPFSAICKDNCMGLCQSCGENLNDNTCKCGKVDYEVSNKIDFDGRTPKKENQ